MASDAQPPVATRRRKRTLIDERYALLVAWAVLAAVFWILRPETFATMATVRTILSSQGVLIIVTLGVLFPLIVGEFDLSIGATLGFAAIFAAQLNAEAGVAWPLAVAAAVLAGVLIGAANGFFVVGLGVDGLVATLGIGTLVTGLGYAVSNYATITGMDVAFVQIVSFQIFRLPLPVYVALLVAAILWYVFRYTASGMHLVFVGQSRDVARLSGLRVQRIRFVAFVVSGLLSAIAGVLLAGTLGGADPNTGASFLLPAYSAAFLGSTVIQPGRFNAWGTVIAVYFLITGITGLQLLGLSDWIQQVFYGLTLVLAVTFSRLVRRTT